MGASRGSPDTRGRRRIDSRRKALNYQVSCRRPRAVAACVGVAALCLLTPIATYGAPACTNLAVSTCSSRPTARTARTHRSSKHKHRKAHTRRHRPKRKRHNTRSSIPRWITLPGSVVAYNEDAILTEDGYVHGDNGGGPIYHLVGTRAGLSIAINDAVGLPVGTSAEGFQPFLTQPLPGHPGGLVILPLRVKTPPSGINPETSTGYFSVFDATTGAHLVTSAPFSEAALFNTPVAYINGDLRLAGCGGYTTISPAGTVSGVPFPPGSPDTGPSCAASAVVDNEILVYSPNEGCEAVYVSNVVTQSIVSQSPCLPSEDRSPSDITSVPLPGSGDWFFNGTAYGAQFARGIFSAATGSPLEPEGELALEKFDILAGIRSSVVLVDASISDPGVGGPSYFVSTSTWQPVFTATSAQRFRAFGLADNDAWVEGAAGRIVINALTGSTVASHWNVLPEAGGAGWTIAGESTGACCSSEYLLRSKGTMLTSLRTAP